MKALLSKLCEAADEIYVQGWVGELVGQGPDISIDSRKLEDGELALKVHFPESLKFVVLKDVELEVDAVEGCTQTKDVYETTILLQFRMNKPITEEDLL